MGNTADEADNQLLSALGEPKLMPETAKRVEPIA
jgi:hypothetical protein